VGISRSEVLAKSKDPIPVGRKMNPERRFKPQEAGREFLAPPLLAASSMGSFDLMPFASE
jgi:hypothetical protein